MEVSINLNVFQYIVKMQVEHFEITGKQISQGEAMELICIQHFQLLQMFAKQSLNQVRNGQANNNNRPADNHHKQRAGGSFPAVCPN